MLALQLALEGDSTLEYIAAGGGEGDLCLFWLVRSKEKLCFKGVDSMGELTRDDELLEMKSWLIFRFCLSWLEIKLWLLEVMNDITSLVLELLRLCVKEDFLEIGPVSNADNWW